MSTYFFHSKRSRSHSRFFYLILCTVLVCPMLLFTGCGNITDADTSTTGNQPISISSIKLNTAVQITIYDSQDKALLDDCLALCDKYELIFSRTNEKSELYKLNHRKNISDEDFSTDGPTTPCPISGTADTWHISEDLAALLSEGLDITRESDGAFDIAIAPLTSLWDFTAEDPEVPDDAAIQKALPLCSSDGVTIDGQDITLPSDDIQFDVGAIAKGYIADRLKDFLIKKRCKKVPSSTLAATSSASVQSPTALPSRSVSRSLLQTAMKQRLLWISPENPLYPPEFMRGALSRTVSYIIIS